MVVFKEDDILHYGILRRSGRYPWGSGGNESGDPLELKDARTFLDYVNYLKRKLGLSDTQVAQDLGISTTRLRAVKTIAKHEEKMAQITMAERLKAKGMSNTAAAERMGIPESTFRTLLAPGARDKSDILIATSDSLRKRVDEMNTGDNQGWLDVGSGVETHMGVSDTRLRTAVEMLKEEGYVTHTVPVPQLGSPGNFTNTKVLAPPGTTWGDVAKTKENIQSIIETSEDGGRTYFGIYTPKSIDPSRVDVRYAEQGGTEADGVIYVRPGVDDISMGGASYAQVRIQVGEDRYLKGMAIYKDDLPDGVDLVFNTNKSDTGNKLDAMKSMRDDDGNIDEANPFGAQISKQILKRDADGAVILRDGIPEVDSVMNIVNEEGDWTNWSKTLSSQMLSKQRPSLIKQQLDLTQDRREQEFNDIMELTNPTVRKKLLEEFADGTDAAAVHLKAAAMPNQASHVILPVSSMKDTEVFAPNYNDGDRVVLIRYPHGGTFEIPELVVNNKQREAVALLGKDARDAIGINSKVAERLSGADFDGDTVLVIPNNSGKVKTAPPLQDLKGFDPRSSYPGFEGMRVMANTQAEMGKVSNLITDMTLQGANEAELARAVKHSMVVIDAEKHKLNYKQSAIDNGIKQLQEKYQTDPATGKGGAATLISRKKRRTYVPERKPRPMSQGGPVDPKTGKRVFVETGRTHWKTGKPHTTKLQGLDATDDAFTLSSGTPVERMYAEHSNRLKSMANKARKEALRTPPTKKSPSAAKTYAREVEQIDAALDLAMRNRPAERHAQVLANAIVDSRRKENPTMDSDSLKKIKWQALEEARTRTGAGKTRFKPTPLQWEAIQAGAISDSKLKDLLNTSDMDAVRELATPRPKKLMSSAKTSRARTMLNSGYTRAEVADALGVSLTTLDEATNS